MEAGSSRHGATPCRSLVGEPSGPQPRNSHSIPTLFQGVAQFLGVVAVAGHPVEAGHPLGQQLAVALEADVDLVAADRQERGIDDLAQACRRSAGL